MQSLSRAKEYSNSRIEQLRAGLSELSVEFPNAVVVVVGSLARREASGESDLDYFIIQDSEDVDLSLFDKIGAAVQEMGFKAPSIDGAFATVVRKSDFIASIGGGDESNADLTRRMLYLLESEWVMGGNIYEEIFSLIIEAYISDKITQHQLARFFLNDLIRYYRTVCVDFEYKTSEIGKSWGDRNIKLLFSRKLMYFGGVLAAAQTAQSTFTFKRSELKRLLKLPATERLTEICGASAERALKTYDMFLSWAEDPEARDLLRETTQDRTQQTEEFRSIKNIAHHFSWDLQSLFIATYPPSHPIHQAMLL
ncbi:hypothetical protein [Stenotrophomonas indicatrix]|uniref:hypothetical protein n=1 Tax=Stenotrophomonas indicatrix TaxID=2045451 RepID=UPI003446A725